jgi:hypothetical protein
MRHSKKFGIMVATASAAFVAALAPAAQAGDLSVCNQRENSHKASGLVPMGPNADPKGRGDKTIGSGKGATKGQLNAADHSPALTTCGTPENGGSSGGGSTGGGSTGGGDTGGGDTGGGDNGEIIIIS